MQARLMGYRQLALVIFAFLHCQCGHQNSSKKTAAPEAALSPYVPDAWDGTQDWSANAFKVQDLNP